MLAGGLVRGSGGALHVKRSDCPRVAGTTLSLSAIHEGAPAPARSGRAGGNERPHCSTPPSERPSLPSTHPGRLRSMSAPRRTSFGSAAMTLYILRRLLWAIVVVNVVVFITFLVFFKLPNGDPALRFAGRVPTTQNLEIIRARLHLNKPFYVE